MIGRLHDRIFLRMVTDAIAEFTAGGCIGVRAWTAAFKAVFYPTRGAVISGGDNPLVFNYYRCHLSTRAVASSGDDMRDLHKVGVPIWAGIDTHSAYVTRCALRGKV